MSRRRSLRNLLARQFMEGYDETPEWFRFNLQTADLALAVIFAAENREAFDRAHLEHIQARAEEGT